MCRAIKRRWKLFALLWTPTFAAILVAAISMHGAEPSTKNSQPNQSQTSDIAAKAGREFEERLHFAPMWMPVQKFPPQLNGEKSVPIPSAAYSMIWEPRWQEELNLSSEQKTGLQDTYARAMAEIDSHREQFQRLSEEQKKVEIEARKGKSAPWSLKLDNEVRKQIESVLTPKQLQTLNDFTFPWYVIGSLYTEKVRREIGFGPEQQAEFRRLATEKQALSQEENMKNAEKIWALMTPQQQAKLPDVVKRQGPTSAILSIAWELGFDYRALSHNYPMLAMRPVRERLKLSPEQDQKIQELMAETARLQKSPPNPPPRDPVNDEKKRVEAILTPEQLTTLKGIEFRRKVVLAMGYPEKRKEIGITDQQWADYQRIFEETHAELYRIDREMLGKVIELLTPVQREQLSAKMEEDKEE